MGYGYNVTLKKRGQRAHKNHCVSARATRHATPMTRARSRSNFPRPYIWRVASLSLQIWPSRRISAFQLILGLDQVLFPLANPSRS